MTTPYHAKYWATLLTLRGPAGTLDALSRSIANARVDLNPHQVDAALFAFRSPFSKGCLLADEVGLGKTIEAGLVLAQKWAERKRKILIVLPATLRKQWHEELGEKFYLPALVLESKNFNQLKKNGTPNPFDQKDQIVLCSYHFVAAKTDEVRQVPWDLVVVDEAHRLRNVYKKDNKIARAIAGAVGSAQKLLLTATPLQNSLMELYGLVSVIDPHVFGDEASFREQFMRAADERHRNMSLRARLKPLCTRTLRKQVMEYIRFTERLPMTIDFTPSDAEHELYEKVSAYLQRPSLAALPSGQRKLMTMILRKLLSSSTFAISGTLNRLVTRLRDLEGVKSAEEAAAEALAQDYETLDETREEWSEDAPPAPQTKSGPDVAAVREELDELRQYAQLAQSITHNAKGDALLAGLRQAFDKVESLGARKKAVIFTESRRTQQFLFDLLTAQGYAGKVAMLNGANTDPVSKSTYEQWLDRHQGKSTVTGLKTVDVKAAIVEEFRERATVLIATEAAAEGVNLQFCSLVVNYDLPWNPQRIEQRIGRCHRYGQDCDVVVVNFLNRKNEADQRVFQLLSEKFRLFDGVFGASDEVLGAIESGVDFERRIAEVYQTCRTAAEIQAAFDSLQSELDSEIQNRMAETRKTLLDNFDEEVHSRLKVHKDEAQAKLNERERWLLNLARQELKAEARFDKQYPRFRYQGSDAPEGFYCVGWQQAVLNGDTHFRVDHPLAVRAIERALARDLLPARVTLDYKAHGARIAVLEPLLGRSGWLEVSKLTVESVETEEFVVLAGQTDDGQPLDEEVYRKLFQLPAQVQETDETAPPSELDALRKAEIIKRLQEVESRNGQYFNEESEKLDRWAEDLKLSLETEIKELDVQIREAKKASKDAAALAEKLEHQKKVKTLEAQRKEKRRRLYEAQDEVDEQRESLIEGIEAQLGNAHTAESCFLVRWTL
ncbi:MAG: DEAD/DEAH box helicase family protein [Planctomycetes bacterium]|nr:DEAD/DEAH box helicase family protein [Planctomycetota bacterium]